MSKSALLGAAAVAALSAAFVTTPAAAQDARPQRPAQAQAPAQTPAQGRPPAQGQEATTVQEVTVTGQRSNLRVDVDRLSYNVANDLQTQTGSIADALRNVPGVEVDLQGNVSLRGDQNVTILVDGRPSGMFRGEGRGDALQSLPADQIERVEVITNPSAAFSPEGTAGVLNLVTKQNRRAGRTFTVRGNVGTDSRWNAGVSGAYSRPGLTVSGDAGYRRDRGEGTFEQLRERRDPITGQFLESRNIADTENVPESRNVRGAIEWDYNRTDRLSAEIRHRAFEVNFDSLGRFEAENALGVVDRAYVRDGEGGFGRSNTGLTTGWRRKWADGHELVADLSLERTEGDRHQRFFTDNTLPSATPDSYEDIRTDLTSDQLRSKIDYQRPLGDEQKLRLGYEVTVDQNEYDNFGARGPTQAALAVDPALTNEFLYDQTVHAVYGTYERPFGENVVAQFGVRVEQALIDIDQVTSNIQASNEYLRAYPTLNVAWSLGEGQRLSAGYSRRIQRPRPEDLNPYVVYVDPQNLRSGNPDLDPQETDSFELGYQYRQGATFYLATLFYRESRKGVTDVVQDQGNGIFLTTRENLGKGRAAGLELNANGRITRTLTYGAGVNVFWNEIEARNLGFAQTRDGWSLGGRFNLNWQPTENDFFQVNGFMQGERLQAQGYAEPSGMLNLGYRRKLNDRLSLTVTGMNVLDSMKQETVIDTPDLRDRFVQRFMKPAAFIGFTYTIGDGNVRRRPEPAFDFDPGVGG